MTLSLVAQDKIHRKNALDAYQSFIVQAPAGSGKTEILIQRFLTLLTTVDAPEEVLAITFTKKAANEMRIRLVKALKQALESNEPSSDHGKETWQLAKKVLQWDKKNNWNLIDNPNQLRIQTIDSLCTFLTKQLPLLSHLGSQPDIAENPKRLYREAIQEVLLHVEENYEWSIAIGKLLLHLDNDMNKLHDLFISLLAKRDQWLPYLHLQSNIDDHLIRTQLEKNLGWVITECLEMLNSLFPQSIREEVLSIGRFAAQQLSLNRISSELTIFNQLNQMPGTAPDDLQAWKAIASLLLTKSFSWRKRVDEKMGFPALSTLKNQQEKLQHTDYRTRYAQVISSLCDNESLRNALAQLFLLPATSYSDDQWDILQAMLQVLKIMAAQLRVSFQTHGQIDFIENAQAALLALGDAEKPTDLALALDYQIKHILVDEFQDTSYTQYHLIEKLTAGWENHDGRTLFIVGDPMQSIYRFREAEVGLFIRMRKTGIGNIKLVPLTLTQNFRSNAAIVNWNNQHFSHIFPALNHIATGAVSYSPSVATQNATDSHDLNSIFVQGFVNGDKFLHANKIVDLIQSLMQKNPQESIALLVRSRSHLAAIIPALKNAKLPYRAIDIDPLASRQVIQDLFSLTCALLNLSDRISWLSILRAPWCGLTLNDLFLIANLDAYASIWELMNKENTLTQLSIDGRSRLQRLLSILKPRVAERDRYDLRFYIENTWQLLGGPACLMDALELEDTNTYFSLLSQLEQQRTALNLNVLQEKMANLYANRSHDGATLQIMTIHTAKGLEFDTVILPHLEKKMPNDDKALLTWMEYPLNTEHNVLLLAPVHATGDNKDAIYEYIHKQQRIKSDLETDRLLYVATTRAKKNLFLYFNISNPEPNHYKIESGSFLEKLWPFFEKNNNILSSEHITPDINSPRVPKIVTRLPATWTNPLIFPEQTLSLHQQTHGFQLTKPTAQIIGIIIHRIMQAFSQAGMAWWHKQSQANILHYLTFHLMQLGMSQQDAKQELPLLLKIVNNVLNDKRAAWILSNHTAAKSEFALTAHLESKTERMVIDRTFVENGIRWIIDYKTTAFTQDDVQHFLEDAQKKHHDQMLKYQRALSMIDDKPIRLGLYFPALTQWKEWEIV